MAKLKAGRLTPVIGHDFITVSVDVEPENEWVSRFTVEFVVPTTDPSAALELAREQVLRMCQAISAAATEPGSLRLHWL